MKSHLRVGARLSLPGEINGLRQTCCYCGQTASEYLETTRNSPLLSYLFFFSRLAIVSEFSLYFYVFSVISSIPHHFSLPPTSLLSANVHLLLCSFLSELFFFIFATFVLFIHLLFVTIFCFLFRYSHWRPHFFRYISPNILCINTLT